MSVTLKFQEAQVGSFGDDTYIMLRLPNYRATIEAKKFIGEMVAEKSYVAELKRYRQKRSLDANAYCWVLCQKLAEVLGLTKEEIYLEHIKAIGQFEIVPVKEETVEKFVAAWSKNGIGWPAEVLDDSKLPGYKRVAAYYGSSTYNTEEMSWLLRNIIQDCKDQGIETLTPEELARMEADWNEQANQGSPDTPRCERGRSGA